MPGPFACPVCATDIDNVDTLDFRAFGFTSAAGPLALATDFGTTISFALSPERPKLINRTGSVATLADDFLILRASALLGSGRLAGQE